MSLNTKTAGCASASERSNLPTETAAAVTSQTGTWLYGVTDSPAAIRRDSFDHLTGVGGGKLHLVAAGGLTAVAETVSLAEFGETALRRNLEDLTWLEATARAHHRVIDALASQVQLVPLRLATVYREDGSVQAMLAEHGPRLRAVLSRTASRAEWGVKAYAAQQPPAARAEDRADSRQAAPTAGSGAAYLRRRRDELTASQQRRQDAMVSAQHVHAALVRLAADARLHPPQSPELTGSNSAMILNAAYLIDDQRAAGFRQAVDDLRRRLPLRLELTGPWPPYSFADAGPDLR
jgi:Gas vesicle synthesis protein GvpL/GvpF